MNKYNKITELLLKHLRQELTPEEWGNLMSWVNESAQNQRFFADINDTPGLMADVRTYEEVRIDLNKAWLRVKALGWEDGINKRVGINRKFRLFRDVATSVAAVLLLAAATFFYFKRSNKEPIEPVVAKARNDPKPVTQMAYLTLDNGKTIVLDSLSNGLLITQGNTKVMKHNGVISYAEGKTANQKLIYNKVTVPKRGDVVNLQLSDGSRVWVNAESSIRYPVAFNDADEERKVEITGEAYFEVAANSPPYGSGLKKRFIVTKGNMRIEVLGTRFNVNTYESEGSIKVTLLEGSVKMQTETNGRKIETNIKPGQQAVLTGDKIDVLSDIDINQVVAWKEGKFVF